MKIVVEENSLIQIKEAVKNLPVRGDFDAADQWVGLVVAIQNLVSNAEEYTEPAEEKTVEE